MLRPFTWNKYVAPSRDTVGQPIETFPCQGTLWGDLSGLSAQQGYEYGGRFSERGATVTLNQLPAVAVQDQLLDLRSNLTYTVEAVYPDHDKRQTVCEVLIRGQ